MIFDDLWWSMMIYDVLWYSMMFYDVLWCFMVFYDVHCCSMVLYRVLWCSLLFYDVLWCSMVFYDVLWCSMMFYVLREFLVFFCRSVSPEFLRSFLLYVEKHYKFEVFRRPCFRVDHSSYMSIVHHTIRVKANKASQQCQQKQKTFITSAIIHPVCAFYKWGW